MARRARETQSRITLPSRREAATTGFQSRDWQDDLKEYIAAQKA
jgi:hypothetical protein